VAVAPPVSGTTNEVAYFAGKTPWPRKPPYAASKNPQARLVSFRKSDSSWNENEELVIGMEIHNDSEVRPGRWVAIPKVSIQEMRVVELDKAFTRRRKKTV